MNYLSLLVPIAYLGVLVGSLATFSSLYRARKVRSKQLLAPYFGPHVQRNIYLSLLHLPDSDPSAPKVPESVLRAALLARAVEDIHRVLEIRTRKQALSQLQQKGIVGDEIWQRLTRANQEMEIEMRDVVAEANALSGGTWGQTIFQSASEMASNAILRKRIDSVKATVPAEKEKWEQTRERSRKELEGEADAGAEAKTAPTAAGATAVKADKKSKTGGIDEDAVMVETPGETAAEAGASGKKGKKKGKK